jgi:hypothetical protein
MTKIKIPKPATLQIIFEVSLLPISRYQAITGACHSIHRLSMDTHNKPILKSYGDIGKLAADQMTITSGNFKSLIIRRL